MANTLNIFTGKKGEYNRLILKSLVAGPKRTIRIAEYLYLNTDDLPAKINKNKVKSINSIICRKNSRLAELSTKGYIVRNNNLWELTQKGLCVGLTLFNDLAEIQKLIDFQQFDLDIKNIFKKTDKHPIIALLKTTEGDNIIKERFGRIENDPQFGELLLYKLRSYTDDMIREGVNLERAR